MLNLSYSFTPDGKWFVFDLATGKTLITGLKTARKARMEWIRQRGTDRPSTTHKRRHAA